MNRRLCVTWQRPSPTSKGCLWRMSCTIPPRIFIACMGKTGCRGSPSTPMPSSVAHDTLCCSILGVVTSVEEMAQHQHTRGADGGANAKQYPLPERPQALLGPDAWRGPVRCCRVASAPDHVAQ